MDRNLWRLYILSIVILFQNLFIYKSIKDSSRREYGGRRSPKLKPPGRYFKVKGKRNTLGCEIIQEIIVVYLSIKLADRDHSIKACRYPSSACLFKSLFFQRYMLDLFSHLSCFVVLFFFNQYTTM